MLNIVLFYWDVAFHCNIDVVVFFFSFLSVMFFRFHVVVPTV